MTRENILSELVPVLQTFDPLYLEELDSADLLERKDIKYVFPVHKAKQVVELLQNHYRVLEVKNSRFTDYETVYYDTPGFKYYFQHHNENLNRFKVRTRRYVQSDISFYEMKFKNNKGWVSKERHSINSLFLNIQESFPEKFKEALEPKLKIDYIRITFLSKDGHEKLTLDFNLKLNHYCPTHYYDNLVIAEMKSKDIAHNIFPDLIKGLNIYPIGISKYCMGITHVYPTVKHNNFKPKLLKIQKIENL